jgi:hypothetical protein
VKNGEESDNCSSGKQDNLKFLACCSEDMPAMEVLVDRYLVKTLFFWVFGRRSVC